MSDALLIVEDDEDILTQMKWALSNEYTVSLAGDRTSCLQEFRDKRPLVVVLDLGLPPFPNDTREGFQVLEDLRVLDPRVKVVVITGQGEKENAQRAIGVGAYDFLCKPADMEELRGILKRAFYVGRLEREFHDLQEQVSEENFEGMLGASAKMREVFSAIRKVAVTDAPVLILGESGTGKEMAAQAIHRRSRCSEGPFVAINCGAIPPNLLESELFGHEKGAFTGAHAMRKGKIEQAEGGTLFLDEIGELPLDLQVKLLRFLQERKVDRVGGKNPIPVEVRVISATNVNIRQAMKEGTFREDLYYRLAVVVMGLPALREREEDRVLMAKRFLQRFGEESQKSQVRFSASAVRAIESHDWPGNVRELENRVKRAVIMAEGNQISHTDLELEVRTNAPSVAGLGLKEARDQVEKEMVQMALSRSKGKITRAASELGISRPTLYELMAKHEITPGDKGVGEA